MKQQLLPYRRGHKLESLDQFERSFDVVEVTELEVVWSSNRKSIEFITVSMSSFTSFFDCLSIQLRPFQCPFSPSIN
ncbi:NADH dehydrogenase subunit K [Iris pallida]|uniref:NADH dehydrogenase subunit K (Plastid) n=1 Tax=Iris pallida TaxID=29817 RepID=A0AAX6EAW0_IRIPA|nr:NADH dehydrogenase subunit K [Iris pallida]KAJ6808068.1 NADH dehydrogenase subunit K [Iris pallida]